ncbi:60S ribosome subunit biogenesis protein NOP8 [Candida tropicalis]
MTDVKEIRLHIGNISPKLKESPESLTSRIEKFGEIIKSLEFHTKPLQLHYFAYITISINDSNLEKLKKSLNGVLFMGMKLSINIAKPSYLERFNKSSESKGSTKKQEEQLRRDKIVKSRLEKIKEYKTNYPTNNITSSIVISSMNPSTYSVSEHTFKNISGNTKNQPPAKRLDGNKSYGALTNPKKLHNQFKLRSGKGMVIRGTLRKSPRSGLALKQQTLRILINGELKTFKCYKTKLWGIEKNKTVRDLTWNYVNGEWRSGDDHVIERCGINGTQARNYGNDIHVEDHEEKEEQEDVEKSAEIDGFKETDKNKSILASMFSNFDFDKPVEIDTINEDDEIEVDSKGRKKAKHYDFEIEGKITDDDDDEEEEEEDRSVEKIDIESANQIIHNFTKTEKPMKEQYYDEDDEGNDIEMDEFTEKFTTEAIKDKYDEEHDQQDSSEEEEFIPTFGSSEKPVVNDTETLRSLFNPTTTTATTATTTTETTSGSFKLGLDEDDEDLDENKQIDSIKQEELFQKIQKQKQDEIILEKKQKFGLFWCHFDSPFLSTQSQLSKLGNDKIKLPGEDQDIKDKGEEDEGEEESKYEKWFWSMRGEISRECKRRKRDVLRSLRKKNNHIKH